MSKAISIFSPPALARWAAPVATFVLVLAALLFLNRDRSEDPLAGLGSVEVARDGVPGDTAATINSLQEAVASDPEDAGAYGLLGDAYLQRARETSDVSYYKRADLAFGEALERDPGEATALVGLGTLELARHDFDAALAQGRLAHRDEPELARPYTVIADAQIELGMYDAAARTLDRLVGLKPTLPAYTRVSYFRELNGDLDGAVQALRLAISAGGGNAESSAFVYSLLGKLEIDRGRYPAAERAYGQALAFDPGYPQATAGLARIDAAAGRLGPAIASLRELVSRIPLPEYAIALAEAELAAGRNAAADRDLALVQAEAGLLAEGGVNTDAELALFEADHGSPGEAMRLGRAGWEAAPSVRSADALAWALHSAGRDAAALRLSTRAMSLGSRDPLFLYRAGIIARDAGRDELARRLLDTLVSQSPGFDVIRGPQAARALEGLG